MDCEIHSSATLSDEVEVGSGAIIGPNCFVDGRVSIGARTRLVANITLVGNARIGEDCILEPNVATSHVAPPDRPNLDQLVIDNGALVGAGSVLCRGVKIGRQARIGAGTVVMRDVPSYAIISGNPASIVGYVTSLAADTPNARRTSENIFDGESNSAVRGVSIVNFPIIRDLRGDLSVGEFDRNVPFVPRRYFLVFDVPSAETRGEHAHKVCEQFLICTSGCVSVVVDDGLKRREILLHSRQIGLYIPPMVWGLQYKYTPGSVLLVFASHYYDPDDYIRNYDDFLEARRAADDKISRS